MSVVSPVTTFINYMKSVSTYMRLYNVSVFDQRLFILTGCNGQPKFFYIYLLVSNQQVLKNGKSDFLLLCVVHRGRCVNVLNGYVRCASSQIPECYC